MKKIIISLLILTTSYLLLTADDQAQTKSATPMISVSPAILNIVLSPGQTYTYEIKLTNLLEVPLPINSFFERLETIDEDKSPVSSLLSWLKTDQQNFIIPAKSTKIVHLTVPLPSRIPIGGYYGLLFFQPLFPHVTAYSSLVGAQIGIPIMAAVGLPDPFIANAKINEFSFDRLWFASGNISFHFRVANLSLSHFSAKPFLNINPLFGHVTKIPLVEKIILPGRTRLWQENISAKIPLGLYRTTLAVSVGNGQQMTQNRILLVMPLTKLFIVLIGILAIFYVYRKRRRLPKILRILWKGK